MSIVKAIEEQVDSNLSRADRFRQTLLRDAFQGKLVPSIGSGKKWGQAAFSIATEG